MVFLAAQIFGLGGVRRKVKKMDLIAALNLEPIFQLTFVSLIMLAGPVVVFLLFLRGGDL